MVCLWHLILNKHVSKTASVATAKEPASSAMMDSPKSPSRNDPKQSVFLAANEEKRLLWIQICPNALQVSEVVSDGQRLCAVIVDNNINNGNNFEVLKNRKKIVPTKWRLLDSYGMPTRKSKGGFGLCSHKSLLYHRQPKLQLWDDHLAQ